MKECKHLLKDITVDRENKRIVCVCGWSTPAAEEDIKLIDGLKGLVSTLTTVEEFAKKGTLTKKKMEPVAAALSGFVKSVKQMKEKETRRLEKISEIRKEEV